MSTAALATVLAAMPASEAYAQSICSTFAPMSGATVTCTFESAPGTDDAQPITTAILAPNATGVSLNIEDMVNRGLNDDAVLRAMQPAISLGAGASIDVQNADISNVDLSGDLVAFDTALFEQGITDLNDLVQALVDAGIPAMIATDEDGDPFIELENNGDIIAANVVFSGLFNDSDGAVIELGAPASINDIDPATLTAIATSPGLNSAAADPNGNFLNLGRLGDITQSADVTALGAAAVEQASGGAASIQLLGAEVSAFGSNSAAVLLDASDGRGGAVEVSVNEDSILNAFGTNAPAILGLGDGVIVGLASTLGSVTTTGNQSPLVKVEGDNAVIHVRLNENDTENADYDFAPYVTLGEESSLFQISGDNARAFFTSNQVGVRNDNGGMQSYGANSDIIRYTIGELSTTNVDFLNSKASTFGDGSGILNLSIGSTSSAEVLFGNATLDTQGDNAVAILVGDTTDSSISTVVLTANTITTLGDNSIGVDVGSVSMIGSLTAQMNGGTITTSGANAHGARFAASGVSDSSVGTIDLQDTVIITSGDGAFGLIVGATAAAGSAADVAIDDFTITTSGRGAVGLQASLGANDNSASSFTMRTTTISTSGDLAGGAVFTTAVGSTVDAGSTVTGVIDGSSIATSGRFADALVIGENVTVFGEPTLLNTPDGAAKLIIEDFNDFTATGLGGRGIQNNGTIVVDGTGVTYDAGKTGRIANAGTIDGTSGAAVTFASNTDDIFELQPTAITIGTVDGAGGTDTFILGGEGTDTFDTALLGTQYLNFETFEKEDLSTWTITGDDTRTWEVRGGDLVIGDATTLSAGSASAVTVTTGLTATEIEGSDVIAVTGGQLFVEVDAAVMSATTDVAAVTVLARTIDGALPSTIPEVTPAQIDAAGFTAILGRADVVLSGAISTSAEGAAGILALGEGDNNAGAIVYGRDGGSISTTGANAAGITSPVTGDAILTVLADGDFAITTSGTGSSAIVGTGAPNSITANLRGDVAIATSGDTAFGIANVGDSGNTTVTAADQVSITTQGVGAHALAHLGNMSAFEVTLSNSASIVTTGDGASAIFGPSGQSATTVTIDGTVQLETIGEDAPVIAVAGLDESVVSIELDLDDSRTGPTLLSRSRGSDLISIAADIGAGGSATVVTLSAAAEQMMSADFETLADDSHVIDVSVGDIGSATFTIENVSLTTGGDGSVAVRTAIGDMSDMQILANGGRIDTSGENADAFNASIGEDGIFSSVIANGTVTTQGVSARGFALDAGTNTDVTAFFGSEIATSGDDAVGIAIAGSVGGANTITISNSVVTSGLRAHAVWLDRQAEAFTLTDTLSTTGDNAKGIGADGGTFVFTLSEDSSITTQGLDSDGVWVAAEAQVPIDSATINANGTITTTGDDASGIWVSTLEGDSFDDGLSESGNDTLAGVADITLAGSIMTSGESAYGIGAEGTGMTIMVDAAGSIDTTGDDGDGIWLDYGDSIFSGGDILDGTVVVDGSILTTGSDAQGIWVDRTGLAIGGTTIDVGGSIRTDGLTSHGISVFYGSDTLGNGGGEDGGASTGTITVSGTIDVRGVGADGIRVYLDNGASTNITVEAGGEVLAAGVDDQAIYLTSDVGATGTASAALSVAGASETAARANVFSQNGIAIAEGDGGFTLLVIDTVLTIAGNVETGVMDGLAIDLSTGDDIVTLSSGGTIVGGIVLGSGSDVITVAGSIVSNTIDAINTGTGDDTVIVLPTAAITGGVDLGSGTDVLAFDGAAGTTGTVELLASTVPFAVGVERTEKRGEGTWIFEGSDVPRDANIAPTFVLNGTAVIRSQILGTATTNGPAGRIIGSGGLGSLINEGTFAPGEDGVGTFTIAGDLTLQSTSVLEIDITAGGMADLIEVGDDAVLGGTLAVNGVLYPTGFPNQQDYVILTAAETVTGTFASVTDNLPDVDVTVAYSDTDVTISYDKGQDLSDKSIQANTVQSGLIDGRLFAETLRRRGVLLGASSGFVDARGQQVAQNGGPDGLASGGKRYAVWGAAMGAIADVASNPGQTGYDIATGGIATGIDGFIPLDDGVVRVGAAIGFSAGDIDNDTSGADVNSWHLGAHVVYENDNLGLSAAASYGFQNYDIDRVIALVGAPSVTATGEADGSVFSLSVGARYTVYESDSLKVSPIAHIEHLSAKRNAYSESGAGILDLNVDAERFDRTFLGAGVRLEAESEGAGGITYRPQLDLMYEHAFGDRTAVVNSQAANLQNIAFTTRGGDQSRNQVAVGAGVAMEITDRVSAHIRYDGNYADGFTSHRGSAGVSVAF